jgi:cell division protein FtsQ
MSTTTVERPKAATIHPRFRARRIEVKRSEGRKRLRRVIALAALAGLIASGYVATRSPLLDLDSVVVNGAVKTDTAAVAAAGGLRTGRPMTDLDVDRARTAIAALPWVDTVQVRRKWPGTVDVDITERRAVAALATDEGAWLVLDATGRVLDEAAARPADLPALATLGPAVAPGGSVPVAEPALALSGYITPDLRAWFVTIVTNPDGTLEADLSGGIRVVFGSQAHLRDKTIGLATVLTRVDLSNLDRIDLTVPSSPVLTRRNANA